MDKCAGQVAVVTGASRGIGRALMIRLAAEGALVVAVSRSAEHSDYGGSLLETVRLADEASGRALPVAANVGTAEDRGRIQQAAANCRPVTIVVNNAAADRLGRCSPC